MQSKVTKKVWATIIFFGLIGQIAWFMENTHFNVYVYNTITDDTMITALMVAFSAATATITTILVGGFCDKVGKRKQFIAIGYIIWGLTTVLFGYVNLHNIENLFGITQPLLLVSILVVLIDCLMTFFGSTANDVAFNAWLTEHVDDQKRGVVEGVTSLLAPLSGLLVTGVALVLLDPAQAEPGKWEIYYLVMGSLISLCGVLGLFLIPKDEKKLTGETESYWKNVAYGFLPSTVKNNKLLYLTLIGVIIEGIAFQVFYPYLIIYIQHVLLITDYFVPMVVIVLSTCLICFVFGYLADKFSIAKLLVVATGVGVAGLLGLFFLTDIVSLCIFGALSIGGLMGISTLFIAMHRSQIPANREASFQGVRIISVVLIPMITGPFIGSFLAKSGATVLELGVEKEVPSNMMFLVSAIIVALVLIPIYLVSQEQRKQKILKEGIFVEKSEPSPASN
jgi:MFS family permease